MGDELYYYDKQTGQYLPERRSITTMEMQQALLKLIANVESMEKNEQIQLQAIDDRISNLDEKIVNRLKYLEERVDNHCDDEGDINDMLDKHDEKLNKAEAYISRIHSLEVGYKELKRNNEELEKRLDDIENKPTKQKAKLIDDLGTKIRNGLLVAVSGAVVAGIIWLFWFVVNNSKIGG